MNAERIMKALETREVVQFVGDSMGRKCNFPVRVKSVHPSLPDVFTVDCLFAENCWYEPGWVNARDLAVIA